MTTPQLDPDEAVEEAIEAAVAGFGESMEAHVSYGTWVELAIATHGGHCPDDPSQHTTPAWDWIDHITDSQSALHIAGTWGGGQCGGCGQLGQGWLHTGAVDLGGVDPAEIADRITAMATALEAQADKAATKEAGELRQALIVKLRAALADLAAGAVEEDVLTGSDVEPGVWRNDDGVIEAWDNDPRDWCSFIAVREADL